ncbi:MAG: hypothetical protein LBS63_04970 [Prevotellaceae bacterium]|jgi:hypothetical protein|nr:hypothetical protein [Prevotellaceae bacterium]
MGVAIRYLLPLLAAALAAAPTATALSRGALRVREDSLRVAIERVADTPVADTGQRMALNRTFAALLEQTLREDSAFLYPFDRVPYLYRVASPNKRVRVFTWNVPLPTEQRYYGFVLARSSAAVSAATVSPLRDRRRATNLVEGIATGPSEWFGALYITLTERYLPATRQTAYTLLGISPCGDGASNKKVVDVLRIDQAGRCTFGAPIFVKKGKVLHRLVFEYSADAVMELRYHERTGQILLSALVPINAQLRGFYPSYVTGDAYHALRFANGQWRMYENVKLPR